MTSFAFIAGLLPLLSVHGASALGNKSIGSGAVGGMLTGVVFGVFVIPVLFVIFQHLQERLSRKRRHRESLEGNVLHVDSGAIEIEKN